MAHTETSQAIFPFLDDAIGGELAKARTDSAGRCAQLLGDFLCSATARTAPQNLEDSIRKFRRKATKPARKKPQQVWPSPHVKTKQPAIRSLALPKFES